VTAPARRAAGAAAIVALALALGACKPTLTALSTAPPGRTGWLDTKHRHLTVSPGVAIAFTCEKMGGPCKDARATSDDPTIAAVVPAHLARLQARMEPGWAVATSMVPVTSFVVVARTPGETRIHVRSGDGDRDLKVTVLAPPRPVAAPGTAAGLATR
jgi:hypothetical protein